MIDITERKIKIEAVDPLVLLGSNDSNLNLVEHRFDSVITVRGDQIIIKGDTKEVKLIERIINEMIAVVQRTGMLEASEVSTIMDIILDGKTQFMPQSQGSDTVFLTSSETIKARTPTQKEYVEKVRKNDICFAIGPAGTGKTYLAVAMALAELRNRRVSRIILSRPAVEAGESLGYLPGDLSEKIDPYLRPLLDALIEMTGAEKAKGYMEKKIIEVIPLAYMRGRTLNNSFIILDEAQNATITQMKMFLTRLGRNSKCVVTGDITQTDLPDKTQSGLANASTVLANIPGIEFVYFQKADVVRHKLVAEIISAYERAEEQAPVRKNRPYEKYGRQQQTEFVHQHDEPTPSTE